MHARTHASLHTTQLEIKEPPEMRQQVTAGGAGFNPPSWQGQQALAVMSRWDSCGDLSTCMQCGINNADVCNDLVNRADVAGNIMLHWNKDAPCLTASEAARCAQQAGAVALIYISPFDTIVTLPPPALCLPPSWPAFSIPSFNVPETYIPAKAWQAWAKCERIDDPNSRQECVRQQSKTPVISILLPSGGSSASLPKVYPHTIREA